MTTESEYECRKCGSRWKGHPPTACPKCDAPPKANRYIRQTSKAGLVVRRYVTLGGEPITTHAEGMSRLWSLRAATEKLRDGHTYRLVRIPPRVDHKAEAERLRAAMVYVREAIKNQLVHNEKKGTTKSTAEHLAVIDTLLAEALRDPGEPGKGGGA